MKTTTGVHLLMLVMGIGSTTASPLQPADSTSVGFTEPNELLPRVEVDLSLDCNQLLDQLIGKMEEYSEYSARVLAIATKSGTYGALAYSVCKVFDQNVLNCNYAGVSVAGAIVVAIQEGFVDAPNLNQGAEAAEGQKATVGRRASTLSTRVAAYLRSENINFDAISPMSARQERRDDGEDNGEVVHVRGVQDTRGLTTDLRIGVREHGEGYIQVAPSTGPLGTRTTNAGYKIVWRSFNRVDGIAQNAAKGFGKIIADDWQKRIVDNRNTVDYIARADFARKGYMDIRIIPETKGFGLSYEDVHDCVN
ncbi:hypothetical protein F4821DRAFT_144274 [Hypoxylon rubiginosum]|uniref:Uncharacterized protein n=1 Tax=Hypoxylon rubiginosum TaxID=110542 RepID=A0ACC0CZR4_9PEZI|nr:hypothetical protein F4821DRAFT_144274 [Hypoxylon rubiginosum]